MRYLHSMVRVADLEAALRFYCDGLGLKQSYRRDEPKGRFTLIFLNADEDTDVGAANPVRRGSAQIELTYNWPDENGVSESYMGGRNFGHLAFEVDDIYGVCAHLQSMGVVINRPPRDGRMAFVKSPDGISIELLQRGGDLPPAEPWASMPNTGSW